MDDQVKRDRLKRICDELGVGPGEALRYLEAFDWNLNWAMEACRNKTLPSLSDQSSPVKEKSASEAPYTPPSVTNPSPISNQEPNPPEQQPRNQRIQKFCEIAHGGATLEEAEFFLGLSNWDVNLAIGYFMGDPLPTPSQPKSNSRRVSGDYRPTTGLLDSLPYAGDEKSAVVALDIMMGNAPALPLPGLTSPSELYDVEIESPPSSPMDVDLTEIEAFEERIPVPQMASSQVNESRISNLLDYPSQLDKENLIGVFCDVAVGTSRDAAIAYLERSHWILQKALGFFCEQRRSGSLPPQSQGSHGITMKEGGSSSSSTNADPTETARPIKEAGEENVREAIPRFASSQVDNLKGKAVDEDSSTKTFPNAFASQDRRIRGPRAAQIPLSVLVADGGSGISVTIPFNPDATVRDICEAIEEINEADDKDYYLESAETGEQYRDLNKTVQWIASRGTTKLMQVYID